MVRKTSIFFLTALSLLFAVTTHAASELEERAAIISNARQLLLTGNFSELESILTAYKKDKSRTPSGLWKFGLIYAAIEDLATELSENGDFAGLEALGAVMQRWAQQFPTSPSPHIAYSEVLVRHGWAYRGGGPASTVKPESWKQFRHYVALARDNLSKHKSISSIDPLWYTVMLTIARAQNWNYLDFETLLNEALDKEPYFYPTYFSALPYLLPQWHGDLVKIDRFARDAVRRTIKVEGQSMYARIYWYASQTEYGSKLFSDSGVVWQRMKTGFDDVVARYPDAWNLNNYAKFACMARDKGVAKQMLQRTQTIVVPQAWPSPTSRQECLAWVQKP